MIGTGYSLWLTPDPADPIGLALAENIKSLATRYQTPVFIPHITLVSDVKLDEPAMQTKTTILAHQLQPYQAELGGIGSNKAYFQIFFRTVKPTSEVMNARRQAEAIFELKPIPYSPHLSLAYGGLSSEEVNALTGLSDDRAVSFQVTAIELWRTIGTFDQWKLIKRYPLHSSGS